MKRKLSKLILLCVACVITLGASAAPDKNYLCFTAGVNNSTIQLVAANTPNPVNLQYSTDDGASWKTFATATIDNKAVVSGGTTITLSSGKKVYFRNTGKATTFSHYSDYKYRYYYFHFTGKVAASGNIMSLVDNDCASTEIPCDYCFYRLFHYSSATGLTCVTSAPEMPATTLKKYCYNEMFYGCRDLTKVPNELPSTTLADYCYQSMFVNCTSLTTAPELPAKTLTTGCYTNMFNGCTSLNNVPELPATTLATSCYAHMFAYCSLDKAPALPATTLADACYSAMFFRCTNLATAPELPATEMKQKCYYAMFQNCPKLSKAPELNVTTLAVRCFNCMFSDCSNLTEAPELPVTELKTECYYGMFSNCTSLTTAPALPAKKMADYCYYNMFAGCTNLTTAPDLPATILANGCYAYMFSGCTNLTTAPDLPATILADNCYGYMFEYCNSLTVAPELPATNLEYYCYEKMFAGCTSLTTAPELPASTLAGYCYNSMFEDCENLTQIAVGFTNDEDYNADYWLGWPEWTEDNPLTIICPEDFNESLPEEMWFFDPNSYTLKHTYDLNVSSVGWASMYVNLPMGIPDGIEVYYASAVDGNTITLTQLTDEIPPHTGVIVKAAEGIVQFPILGKEITAVGGNLFEGTSVDKTFDAEKNGEVYVLAGVNAESGNPQFKNYTGDTLGAHKSYLPKSVLPSDAKEIKFVFDEVTPSGINTLTPALSTGNGTTYNLNGMKVNKSYNGIVVVDGKKYINK
ncbi:MAG: leucine-rich repeat domain-containing protein [Bacteroidaceae bacterium]|nr:leucine-rich repeat domain-containing protein [Bacteroidaceae bacterium]